MKRVLTNNIVANVRRQRLPKSSLDHLQDISDEAVEALLSILNINPAVVTIVTGCETDYEGGESAGTFTVNAGWIAYQSKLYKVAFNDALVMASGKTIVFKLVTTYTDNDPVGFDDNNTFNVNQTISIVTEVNDPGEELCDYYDAVKFAQPELTSMAAINGWTGTIKYFKDWNDDVVIMLNSLDGAAQSSTNIGSMPAGFRPLQNYTYIGAGRVGGVLKTCRITVQTGGTIFIEDISGAGAIDGDTSGPEIRYRAYQ